MGLALVATAIIVLVRQARGGDVALLISLTAGVLIFFPLLEKMRLVVTVLSEISQKAGINPFYWQSVLKAIGIAYIAEFGSQLCRDAGEGAIASKLETAGKVLILVLAIPLIVAVLETIVKLLP